LCPFLPGTLAMNGPGSTLESPERLSMAPASLLFCIS